MNESEAQRREYEWIENEFDEGAVEGYDADPNVLPYWWFSIPPGTLTARQRGYWFGRETRIQEMKT